MGKYLILKAGGGGIDPDDLTANADDVVKGKIAGVAGQDDPVAGTLELTGTAVAGDVLSGKTYYTTNPKTKQTGTMANRGAVSQALNAGGTYTIPGGYHNGSGKVTANSLASQTSATATAAYISSGKTAWVNGSKVTGTLATQGGSTTTPGTANKTIVTASKHVTGNIVVAGNGNLVAGNIKKGVNIFGVTGTFQGYVPTTTDLYLRGNNIKNWLTKQPAVSFDLGQISMNDTGYGKQIYSATTLNFVGFTKFNVELNAIAFNSEASYVPIFRLSAGTSMDPGYLGSAVIETITTSKVSGNQTISFNLSAVQINKYINFMVGYCKCAIYRIWLS